MTEQKNNAAVVKFIAYSLFGIFMLLLRINSVAKGNSGLKLATVQLMIAMLNSGVTPYIPEKGSLGASGDLALLAHMVQPMIGVGEAYYRGELMSSTEAMKKAGLTIIRLESKEGLALINGTQAMCAFGALALYDGEQLARLADVLAAMAGTFNHNLYASVPSALGKLA